MSKKKVEREVRAAHRRNKKDKQHLGNDFDDFLSLNNQLGTMGLSLKQIPGDGNCLFRALGDQLDGNAGDHLHHRTNAVNYMRQHREDFEPFVEDDISFDSHLASLAENGTFGGNDSIVAFARLHDLTVVIHQLNKPLWQIHGGVGGNPGSQEVHISYHNGDHYNSVRRMGDLGNTPARIRLCLASKEERRTNTGYTNCDNYQEEEDPSPDSGQESDYENSPSNSKLNKLANEVSRLSGVDVKREVFDALEVNAYCVTAAVDYLLNDAVSLAKSNLWSSGGTGSRIFGDSAAVKAVTGRSPSRSAQEKLVNIQQKLQNKNISNKKRKELKKNQRKLHANEEMRRGSAAGGINQCDDETDLVIANVEALTI
eukprot:GFUD01056189.1.p1 GENE.GFUD01056189.1~~GFUD01056189.1.p1  ORF type:complete len:370 (+),score=100.12 GFUD01056189.1:47-1156(+)